MEKNLGKIVYVDIPDGELDWKIQEEDSYYIAIILDKNGNPFYEYITPSGRTIVYPEGYYRSPIITQIYHRKYTPESIYNINAILTTQRNEIFR